MRRQPLTSRERAVWETYADAFATIGMPNPAVESSELWACYFRFVCLRYLQESGWKIDAMLAVKPHTLVEAVIQAAEARRKASAGDA